MRITFSDDEYDELIEILRKHRELEYAEKMHKKYKESLPSAEGFQNKKNATKKAHGRNKRRSSSRVDIAIKDLERAKEDISISSVAKTAGMSYNTAKQYKVRIKLESARIKSIREEKNL